MHRGTGSVTGLIGALYLWPVRRQLTHANLIAIIEEWHTRHREAEGIDDLQFLVGTLVAQAGIVVITQRQRDIALANGLLVLVHITRQEVGDGAFALCIEVTVPLAHAVEDAPTLLLEQVVVALEPMEEIHVEAVVECISGVRPFCHHESLWVLFLEQLTDFAPEEFGLVLVGVEELFITSNPTCLHQCTSHIGTEAVGTHIHPEAQHVFQVFTHCHHVGMVGRQLPFLIGVGVGKSEVQGWLTPVEITHELSVTLSIAFHKLSCKLHGGIHPVGLRPDIVVGVFVGRLLLGGHKPWVIDSGITDHIVEDDMHPPFVGFLEELSGILVGTIAWGYLVVVADVIAGIVERGVEEGIKPDGIHA